MARYFHIVTMGCQMNEYDSDHLGQVLVSRQYLPVDRPEGADLILINTCTVRAKAEHKAMSCLGRMAKLKRRRPDLILGIAGCIAQQEGAALAEQFPELDLVLGTREVYRFHEILDRLEAQEERVIAVDLDRNLDPPLIASNGYFKGRLKGYITVMQGCDNFCTYCIVPYVRGRETSRSPAEIMKEARRMVSQGVREITLLGQNVNSYRWGDSYGFPALLREISLVDGLRRLRFTTSHPKDLSGDLILCFKELENLCGHIHLPFQAGSNRILRRMNRKYTREEYMELIERLRRARPDIAVTSDVMVGFPGETVEDFESTMDLIRQVRFDGLYSFQYSDRRGTAAARMKGKIHEEEKSARLKELQELQERITYEINRGLEGRVLEVMADGRSRKGQGLTGRTSTNKAVNFKCDLNRLGDLINVRIKHGYAHSLWGELA